MRIGSYLAKSSEYHAIEKVLDAGAGRSLPFELPRDARLTGLDISDASLADNPDLDERIVGDIETCQLPPSHFDLVVCWNVLEHLRRPGIAIENLASALCPGGWLIISVPSLTVPKTIVTKFTPHSFHVWVYRELFANPDAGRPGHPPFRTHLRSELLPWRLRGTFGRLGLSVESEMRYSSGMVAAVVGRRASFRAGWTVVDAMWRVFGADPNLTDIVWIVRKPGASQRTESAY